MKWLVELNCAGKGIAEVEATYEMSAERMADLERRVLALEERARRVLWHGEAQAGREEQLALAYGEYVDKTVAAKILGVTRTTVYAMLADGRIQGACAGRRVDVRSIARYMTQPEEECGAMRRSRRRSAAS